MQLLGKGSYDKELKRSFASMMNRSVLGKVSRRLARYGGTRRVSLPTDRIFASFTFDDIPKSACAHGAAILQSEKVSGTFYACGGMVQPKNEEPYHDAEDLRLLERQGHEIGSHGFAHLDYQTLSSHQIEADLERNFSYFKQIGVRRPENFAFPYGCVNLSAKAIAMRYFNSCRGVEHAPNRDHADLGLLKCFHLYSSKLTEGALEDLFASTQAGTWLIFLTHGVREDAGPFDATPRLLQTAVRLARAQAEVLTVSKALEAVRVS